MQVCIDMWVNLRIERSASLTGSVEMNLSYKHNDKIQAHTHTHNERLNEKRGGRGGDHGRGKRKRRVEHDPSHPHRQVKKSKTFKPNDR